MTVCACCQTPLFADLQLHKCHGVLHHQSYSRGTHLDLFCVPVPAIASLGEIIQVLVLMWTWIFSLRCFQYTNDHIPEEKYFHEVNCVFKVLQYFRHFKQECNC